MTHQLKSCDVTRRSFWGKQAVRARLALLMNRGRGRAIAARPAQTLRPARGHRRDTQVRVPLVRGVPARARRARRGPGREQYVCLEDETCTCLSDRDGVSRGIAGLWFSQPAGPKRRLQRRVVPLARHAAGQFAVLPRHPRRRRGVIAQSFRQGNDLQPEFSGRHCNGLCFPITQGKCMQRARH